MRFRTEIEPLNHKGTIDHKTKILLVGSCFTDEIGNRLRNGLFDVEVNPFGTLYNPESIANEISSTIEGIHFTDKDFFIEGEKWHTFRRHSRFSMADKQVMVSNLNDDIDRFKDYLLQTDILIVTFGSAIAFRHKESNQIVANCHKCNSNNFVRKNFSVDQIVCRWTALINQLREQNPNLKVIFTVSPVRHSGYGLVADRISKSTLTLACNQLVNTLPNTYYFPSYEIMVDDLRDYRFYKDDLVHPSELAVDYIYDIFMQSFTSPTTIAYATRWEKVTARLYHKMPEGKERDEFRKATFEVASKLATESNNSEILIHRFSTLSESLSND